MSDTFRAFIAIDLPENVRSSLGAAQETLKSFELRVKWVQPENIHLTLKFLGDIDPRQVDGIVNGMRLAASGCAVLSLAAKGIGVFPHLRRPRVIWAGLSGQLQPLRSLQQRLDAQLADLGFPRETRAFKAHLTLGRVKGKIAAGRLQAAMDRLENFESNLFEVRRIFLFKSELRPTGAVYTQLKGIPF